MRTAFLFSIFPVAACLGANILSGCRPEQRTPLLLAETATSVTVTEEAAEDTTEQRFIRVALVGDIMPGTTFPDSVDGTHLPRNNGKELFRHTAPILREADAAFGNLETNLLDSGGNIKKCQNPNTYYVFRTPALYADILAEAGFDALGIANNHTNDLGEEGRRSTRSVLSRSPLAFAGHTTVAESTIFERRGTTFGFCAFSVSPLTPDLRDTAQVARILCSLRPQCHILVVSFHAGGEGMAFRHIPFDKEEYLGRNQGNVVDFARFCIDRGADLVFGHGPHLPRAVEVYKEHLIAYSLGNFCTPYRVSLQGRLGYAPLLTADLTENGELAGGFIHAFVQQRGEGPVPDSLFRAAEEIRQLTKEDFPHTSLKIHPDGRMERKRKDI